MEQNNTQSTTGNIKDQFNQSFDVKRFAASVVSYWYWILLCILLGLGCAFVYVRYTTPQYLVKSSLLLEGGEKGGGSSSGGSMLKKIGIQDEGVSIYNEIMLLKSLDLIEDVVDSLDLNVRYWVKGVVKENEIYEQSPIKIVFDTSGYKGIEDELFVQQKSEQNKSLEGTFEVTYKERVTRIPFDSWTTMPFGRFKIVYAQGASVNPGYLNAPIRVTINTPKATIAPFLKGLQIVPTDGRTSMLELSLMDNVPRRAIDFLSVLVAKYHFNELENTRKSAQRTIAFIDKRQASLADELKAVDSKVEGIKVSNNMIDVGEQGGAYVAGQAESQQKIRDLMFQKQALNTVTSSISTISDNKNPLIAGVNITDPVLSGLITQYNTLVHKVEVENQPLLNHTRRSDEAEIASLRKRILDAVSKNISSIDIALQNASQNSAEYGSLIRAIPRIDRSINDVKRSYDVLQSMYLTLYQKGLETEISLYAAAPKSKVVVEPYSLSRPVAPVPKNAYLLAFFLGLAVPCGILASKELLNNKVMNESDIEAMTHIPILGSVNKAKTGGDVVIGPSVRTGIAEQFRLLRTNLEFMAVNDNKKVIMITSSMSGEGKTFISINLAMTIALTHKKVLVMEFDLCKPKISDRLNLDREGGISAYLAGVIDDLEKVVKPSGIHENLYVANCGAIPPNPGELILQPRNQQMLEGLSAMFDVIIIDTAPVGMVSDAAILARYAGVTVFVARQAKTIKGQLKMLDVLYKSRKISNPAIVFNGVERSKKFGYGYGQGYGYGYGYGGDGTEGGYYEEEQEKRPSGWFGRKKKSS